MLFEQARLPKAYITMYNWFYNVALPALQPCLAYFPVLMLIMGHAEQQVLSTNDRCY